MKCKVVLICFLMVLLIVQIAAAEPYEGYTYNSYGERVPSPNGYLPSKVIQGINLGIGHFKNPADIVTDQYDNLYILDSGNQRIVILDSEFNLKKVINQFQYNGKVEKLNDPTGIFVDKNGIIYIADKGNRRVLSLNQDGIIHKIYGKPETSLIGGNIIYGPRKLVVNSIGTIYIISDNINQGLVSIDPDGNFLGFYGSNKIQATLEILNEMLWRKFSTREQIKQRQSFQPVEYSNLYIDEDDFVYTSTAYEGVTKAQLKKLNPMGNNLLPDITYGDLQPEFINNAPVNSAFVDICADDDEFIYGLDRNMGRIFMYNQRSDLLMVFGKIGNNAGNFGDPVALETIGDKVIVLDSLKCSITIFEPTLYGKKIREAVLLHEAGKFEEALKPWEIVKELNTNYDMAYVGIGRAMELTENYEAAMENFYVGNNKFLYSDAKKEHRTEILRANFSVYVTVFLLAIVLIRIAVKYRKKIKAYLLHVNLKRKGVNVNE